MKKFLTVLLVIAVMFTFSFGSAFAAAPSYDEANLIKAAADHVKANLAANYETAYKQVIAKEAVDYITEDAWAAETANAVAAMSASVDYWVEKYLVETANIADTTWKDYPTNVAYAASKLFPQFDFEDIYTYLVNGTELGDGTTNWTTLEAAEAQFKMDFDKHLAVYDKVDLDSLYSKTTPTADNSYYKQAADAIDADKTLLKEFYFDAKGNAQNISTLSVAGFKAESDYIKAAVNGGNKTLGGDAAKTITGVANVKYDGTSVVKYYYVANEAIKMMSVEEVDSAIEAAQVAALKAQVAANVANFLKTNTGSADKAFAADYATVYNFLAEVAPTVIAEKIYAQADVTKMEYIQDNFTIEAAVDAIEELNFEAERFAAEKDENGVTVRDAKAIAKAVKKATVFEYDKAANMGGKVFDAVYGTTAADYDAEDAWYAISGMSVDMNAEKLAFDKEAKKADLADELDAFVENETYYDLEFAAVKAEYEKAYAKVDAADEVADFDAIEKALDKAVDKILTADEVEALFTTGAMKTELTKQANALNAYLKYADYGIAAFDAANIQYENADEAALLTEYYIENDARTAAEMKALTGAVEAVAATIPTLGELDAAEKAAKAAVKAVPSVAKITSADKDVIVAAYEAIEAYEDLCDIAKVAKTEYEVADEIDALEAALQEDINLAYAKADKTDKAALKAIAAEVEAINEELEDLGIEVVDPTEEALERIQAAEAAAVAKAIRAIPINLTEADKATVMKARELYDAYVAEYTDVDDAEEGFVAADFDYVTLVRAEAALGLNEVDAAYSVEALKITAKSSAKKGSITVKWTVEGDTDAVEGYEIWKSTKKNSGFKKAFTATKMSYKNTKGLKKGTRYFYKVRAIAYTEEGVKVTSDWSNKAYRIAK